MGRGGGAGEGVDLAGCFGDVYALSDEERAEAVRVIGKPSELTQAAKLAALPEWKRWHDTIVSGLATATGDGDALRVLAKVEQDLAEDEAIAASLYETQLHAHMAGQLFVRAVEVPEVGQYDPAPPPPADVDRVAPVGTSVVSRSGVPGPVAFSKHRRVLDANDGRPSFFRLSFREALESFLARGIITPEEFQALSVEARAQSWSATRLASQHLVQRARDLLARHLDEGGTLSQFITELGEGAVTLGIEPNPPDRTPSTWYLETVYRTSTQQAYGAGRLRQLEQPAVVQARPFVQYRTARDTRVRPRHAALDGVVFNRSTDGGWRRFAPPLGFNCRCSLVTLRSSRVQESDVRSSAELGDLGPDPGWSGPG